LEWVPNTKYDEKKTEAMRSKVGSIAQNPDDRSLDMSCLPTRVGSEEGPEVGVLLGIGVGI